MAPVSAIRPHHWLLCGEGLAAAWLLEADESSFHCFQILPCAASLYTYAIPPRACDFCTGDGLLSPRGPWEPHGPDHEGHHWLVITHAGYAE